MGDLEVSGEKCPGNQAHLQNLQNVHKRKMSNFPEPKCWHTQPQNIHFSFFMQSYSDPPDYWFFIQLIPSLLFINFMFFFYCIKFVSVCYVIYLKIGYNVMKMFLVCWFSKHIFIIKLYPGVNVHCIIWHCPSV